MQKIIRSILTLLLLAQVAVSRAEDIDLFVGTPRSSSDAPNVLIILDNTANWNQAFTNEMSALNTVFSGLPANKFSVGLMMFTETGGGNSNTDGSYVRAAIRLMDASNKAKYAALFTSFDKLNDKSNGGKAGKTMEEAYLYFTGGAPYAGNGKNKTDYAGNISGTTQDNAIYALSGNALSGKNATSYNKPSQASGCTHNYIIYISNGPVQDNASDTSQATTALSTAGGNTTTIPVSPSGSQDNVADEWSRFLKQSPVGAAVYTIDVNKTTTGQGPGWTALLRSMASVSSGKYFDVASSGTQIVDALNEIFSEIQSVNSVFASVSLPLSVNTQGTYLNQVYVGMFRPDPDDAPRWAGNLKQYKLGRDSGNKVVLQDADSASAINSQTGFITECARSFWTPTTTNTDWTSRPQGGCLTISDSMNSDYPDGNIVDKGAQSYMLRHRTDARVLKTCSSASCTSLLSFDNTNVTQTALGAASTAERDDLINWASGKDVDDENNNGITLAEARLSVHGDVVHSRPLAVNLGTDASPQIVSFYGSNDGWFKAINGTRTTAFGTRSAGDEFWAFMPPEFIPQIKRLRDNTTRISYPGVTGTASPKAYGIDGPVTAFQGTVGGSSKTFVYAPMRRGGRFMYAFDATNAVSAATTPALKWRIGCPSSANDTGCSTGFTGMGQAWSSLKSFQTATYGSGATPLLIFGGGYDTCEDYDAGTTGGANNNCTSSAKGHYIYVINADTGALVRTFDTGQNRSVVADVTIVRDATGKAIYAYTADMGGNVYRIGFAGTTEADWTLTRIASLGCSTTATCTANRKFMFAPSVVPVNGGYGILLGSGDREKPLLSYTSAMAVTNYFFMFIDKPAVAATIYPGSADCGANIICLGSLLSIPDASTPSDTTLASKKGWYLSLAATEQVVTSAITVFGVVTFSTNQPTPANAAACTSNLGITLVYNINYQNAQGISSNNTNTTNVARYQLVSGGGLPPSPVAGPVKLDSGENITFCIGCSADSPLQASELKSTGTGAQPKRRLFWLIEK